MRCETSFARGQGSVVQRSLGRQVKEVSFARKPDGFEAEVSLYVPKKESILDVLARLSAFPGVQVESLE